MQIQFEDEMKPGGITNMTDDRIKLLTGWVTMLKLTRSIMVKPYILDKEIKSYSTAIDLNLEGRILNSTVGFCSS